MDSQAYSSNPGYVAQSAYNSYQAPPAAPTQPGPVPTANLPKPTAPKKKKQHGFFITVVAIVASLVAVTFIGLFIWMWLQWSYLQSDMNAQIDSATAIAVSANTSALEEEFSQREKYPYSLFSAPEDYGSLEFEYPRTWSVYIINDASNGGTFSAVLNPGSVVAGSSIYALHVTIEAKAYESIISGYVDRVSAGLLTHSTMMINGATANLYSDGATTLAFIKIRDKVATLSTDAAVYNDDFYTILNSLKYNA